MIITRQQREIFSTHNVYKLKTIDFNIRVVFFILQHIDERPLLVFCHYTLFYSLIIIITYILLLEQYIFILSVF